jgi:hypothetical protein
LHERLSSLLGSQELVERRDGLTGASHESPALKKRENAKVYIRATRSIGNGPLVVAFHGLPRKFFSRAAVRRM